MRGCVHDSERLPEMIIKHNLYNYKTLKQDWSVQSQNITMCHYLADQLFASALSFPNNCSK